MSNDRTKAMRMIIKNYYHQVNESVYDEKETQEQIEEYLKNNEIIYLKAVYSPN